jgi:pimeloyl-ACP methyl ester carboxylesterase
MASDDSGHGEPTWFARAMACKSSHGTVQVDGTAIHYLQWEGGRDDRPLLLVHGNGAHAHWWSFLAPALAASRPVAAIDLGGMGDSGARRTYTPDGFADELEAVASRLATETGFRTVDVAAHSFGGLVSIWWAGRRPPGLGRLVLLDVPFMTAGYRPGHRRDGYSRKIFASREEALARFRLLPAQPCENAFLVDHVARHSLTREGGDWMWKIKANPWDDEGFRGNFWGELASAAGRIAVPVTMIRGELSELCPTAMEERWRAMIRQALDIRVIKGSRHHVMLDAPLETAALINAILS